MLYVIKHAVDDIVFFQQQRISCCTAKLHFFDSYSPNSPKMNSNDYSTKFMESCGITYELQISIIKKIKHQLAELWQTINTASIMRDFRVLVFPQLRWKDKYHSLE